MDIRSPSPKENPFPEKTPFGRGAMLPRLTATAGRRRLLSLGLGLLSVAALPPLGWVPLLIPAFAGLLWLLQWEERGRGAFLLGWLFGLGHFLAGLHWLVNPFLVDAERHAWLAPFALTALAGWMAVFPAFSLWLAWRSRARGIALILVFAATWTIGEWARGWVFTGFPWNQLATVWNQVPAMMQPASVVGALGLGLMTVLIAAMPLAALQRQPGGRTATALTAIGLALIWIAGAWRLDQAPATPATGITLRVVQPNIEQSEKWRPENRRAIFDRLLSLSLGDGGPAPDIIVWPEAATPFYLDESDGALSAIGGLLDEGGVLITGAPRRQMAAAGDYRYHNSVLVIDPRGGVVARYDKSHLVPFGEYVPFRDILPLDKLVQGAGDFSPGERRDNMIRLDGLPDVAPLICYEALFADEIHFDPLRPGWLVNVTNDAWFGPGAGPRQHLAAARLRAVEQGLPMIRAANTGISAIIDGHGRPLKILDLGRTGYLDAALPPALPATLFSRVNLGAPILLVTLCLFGAWIWQRVLPFHRRKKAKQAESTA